MRGMEALGWTRAQWPDVDPASAKQVGNDVFPHGKMKLRNSDIEGEREPRSRVRQRHIEVPVGELNHMGDQVVQIFQWIVLETLERANQIVFPVPEGEIENGGDVIRPKPVGDVDCRVGQAQKPGDEFGQVPAAPEFEHRMNILAPSDRRALQIDRCPLSQTMLVEVIGEVLVVLTALSAVQFGRIPGLGFQSLIFRIAAHSLVVRA